MAVLHDELNRIIGELCAGDSVKREVLRCIFARHGVSVTESQLDSVLQAVNDSQASDSVQVDIDGLNESLAITSDDIEHAMLEVENKLDAKVERAVHHAVEQIAPDILKSLYEALPQALEERRAAQGNFEERLHERWKEGIDRLEMLIIMAHEAGETYADDLRREFEGQAASQNSVLIDVLVALHCRACRTAREILCLLKGGYADGANARWRSLHEIAVTAHFLLQHGGDTPQRYLDHAAVERWSAAKQYQTYCGTLGYEPLSDTELAGIKRESDDAIAKYGDPFETEYGWAADVLAKKRPKFAEIEANLDMSEWRPFFKLACQSVHAGSQGLHFSLGLPEDSGAMLIAGASDVGLAEPGHRTAVSLMLASVALLTSHPNMDSLVTSKCMLLLCDDIEAVFSQAQDSEDRGNKTPPPEEAPRQ